MVRDGSSSVWKYCELIVILRFPYSRPKYRKENKKIIVSYKKK